MENQATTRLRRSCEACRASRTRCCPSDQHPQRCQRCVLSHKECVFQHARTRPKHAKTSRARVDEMEKKVENIYTLLSSGSLALPPGELSRMETQVFTQQNSSQDTISTPSTHHQYGTDNDARKGHIWLRIDPTMDVIEKDIVSFEQATDYLQVYDINRSNFPFVVIQQHESLDLLRRCKPFLLLAILTISARADRQQQIRLEIELRQSLSNKVIMKGEKSLDLLQGLLVYLCWYQHFFNPENEQIYQLCALAVAMAEDLGITSGNYVFVDQGKQEQNVSHVGRLQDMEARRTFLGTYYLSSCFSIIFKRRNKLSYSDYVDDCCLVIAKANKEPSDHLIGYFLRLQRLAEEVNYAFDYHHYHQLPFLDSMRIAMLIEIFANQLKQLKSSFPDEVWNNASLRLAYLNAKVYINEIGFHSAQFSSADTNSISLHNWNSSVDRSKTLQRALEATRDYLDEYIILSSDELRKQTCIELGQLVYAITIIGKFTSGVWTPDIDALHFREGAKWHYYMKTLMKRFRGLVTLDENGREHINIFWHCRRLMGHIEKLYEPQISGGYFTTLERSGLPDVCMDLFVNKILLLGTDHEPTEHTTVPAERVPEKDDWSFDTLERWLSFPVDHDALLNYE